MMVSALRLLGAGMLILAMAGCAALSPDRGLEKVSGLSRPATGADLVSIRDDNDEASARSVVSPLLKKSLSVDDAVRIALLSNRELQAAYNAVGISEADALSARLPPNPRFSIERIAGGGGVEIEARAIASLLALVSLPSKAEIGQERFAQAQYQAAIATLSIAARTRQAYFRAVAAQSLVDFLVQSESAAKSAAQLSNRLGEAGSLNRLDQARNQVFYAELSAQLGGARQRAASEREALVRAMGLWGSDIGFKLPARLPRVPDRPVRLDTIEVEAIARRLDLQVARLEVSALGKMYGLTSATRFINLLEVAGIQKETRSGDETSRERGLELEFEVPLFDLGQVKARKAEEAYMQAVNRLVAKAVDVRSEARDAYRNYRARYDLARHYEREVLPLRKIISDETLLRYNAMQIDVFALLQEARQRIGSTISAVEAQRDFFIAQTELGVAVLGGAQSGPSQQQSASSSPMIESGGH